MDLSSIPEALAVVLNLAYVVLAIFQSMWCWPAGLAGAGLSLFVFLQARLYAATALQGVYIALMVYGWRQWRHGGEEGGELAVSWTSPRWRLALSTAGLAFSAALGLFLWQRTDAALPFWDAGTTSFSLVAQFMTTRKWLESWLVWIVVDVVYVGMLLSRELYMMTVLYSAYLVLAVLGFVKWRRSLGAEPVGEVG
jgi:nicotinamide mononucleotide transporter